jgi:hypothetical protein
MANYYPLIARAVAGLDLNTGDARRTLYERARTALVAQLRGVEPKLDDSEMTRERLALEEAIRKVETESIRRILAEPSGTVSKPSGTVSKARVSAPDPKRWEAVARWDDLLRSSSTKMPSPPRKLAVAPSWPEPVPKRPKAAASSSAPISGTLAEPGAVDRIFNEPPEPAAFTARNSSE